MANTIFALSSGGLPSGVALVRLSGPDAISIVERMAGKSLSRRQATVTTIKDPTTGAVLDKGIVVTFRGPGSFTGEDVAELHCHGGRATVSAVLRALGEQKNCVPAEAGEFSRRAFENGKMDLTELEGLSDLIAAETESQRLLALNQSGGSLRSVYDGWRSELIRARALIEAELDFSDEDDVPGGVSEQVWALVLELLGEVEAHLDDQRRGEIVRSGFRVALLGPPNSGKSSLLNALARRDVAIVTPIAGTTRDVIESTVDIGCVKVIVSDTAGVRDTDDAIEQEGIVRSHRAAEQADLVLWLSACSDDVDLTLMPDRAVLVRTKSDIDHPDAVNQNVTINTVSSDGLDALLKFIDEQVSELTRELENPLITRERHRLVLHEVASSLKNALRENLDIEFRSEYLRTTAEALGKLTGRIDAEDLLDVIFSEFCIGK